MPYNIHLKLDGVEGQSTDEDYEKAMDVVHWQWDIKQEGASGSAPGKCKVENLKIYKPIDSGSPTLALRCLDGNVIKNGTLTQSRQAGGKETVYIKLELENVRVAYTSMCAAPKNGAQEFEREEVGSAPVEEIGLVFGKVKVEYTPIDRFTQKVGTPVPISWDVRTNKA